MKVLLIDDSNFSLTMMKNQITELLPDADIISTTKAREGMEIFNEENPEIVVTDLLMPDITGEEIVKFIRLSNKDCFICVASANIQKIVQEELIALGADLFLEKPMNKEKGETLLKAIKQRYDALR